MYMYIYTSAMIVYALTAQKQKHTIHQLTTMLANSKYVLFPGHKNLATTGTDDRSL